MSADNIDPLLPSTSTLSAALLLALTGVASADPRRGAEVDCDAFSAARESVVRVSRGGDIRKDEWLGILMLRDLMSGELKLPESWLKMRIPGDDDESASGPGDAPYDDPAFVKYVQSQLKLGLKPREVFRFRVRDDGDGLGDRPLPNGGRGVGGRAWRRAGAASGAAAGAVVSARTASRAAGRDCASRHVAANAVFKEILAMNMHRRRGGGWQQVQRLKQATAARLLAKRAAAAVAGADGGAAPLASPFLRLETGRLLDAGDAGSSDNGETGGGPQEADGGGSDGSETDQDRRPGAAAAKSGAGTDDKAAAATGKKKTSGASKKGTGLKGSAKRRGPVGRARRWTRCPRAKHRGAGAGVRPSAGRGGRTSWCPPRAPRGPVGRGSSSER